MTWWPWIAAAALYGLFRLYYDNWRGKLTHAEIDTFMQRAAEQRDTSGPGAEANDPATIRAFLEADDGREFLMLNLVRIAPGDVPHPVTGQPTPGRDLLRLYTNPFIAALIRRGGHPALAARTAGGYIDAWGVPPDPGWSIAGLMRYRSRRDLMQLATDPRFKDIHQFKLAGITETFSFPVQPFLRLFVGPRLWLALLLALAAALTQLALLSR
jgi:hypothetical protein